MCCQNAAGGVAGGAAGEAGSRLVQGFRARCGRRCCCRAGRALRGQGGMRWKGHGEGTAAMWGVPCDTVVYIPLSGLDIGALVALRPALACLSSCSRKTSVVCAQCRHINTHEILAALPSCTRYACNEHANLCTCVTVRDRRVCEHGRQRAPVQPGPGVLDLEAARN